MLIYTHEQMHHIKIHEAEHVDSKVIIHKRVVYNVIEKTKMDNTQHFKHMHENICLWGKCIIKWLIFVSFNIPYKKSIQGYFK
jgi:hypothetical protein